MFATADFSGHDQGYLAVEAAVRHLRGEKVPPDIMLPVMIVDKDNVAKVARRRRSDPVPNWDKTARA